ncbi:MAG: elongation factor G, partial [Myxococcota bacterium]
EREPIILEAMEFPKPVIHVVVEPRAEEDREQLEEALAKLASEDPRFRVSVDEDTGQTLIAGQGELHLEIIVDRLRREFRVDALVGAPRVAYRETLTERVAHREEYRRQVGERGVYAEVELVLEPLERGAGIEFKDETARSGVPASYVSAVEKGVLEAAESGELAGYPVTDIRVRLRELKHHEVDSNEVVFKIASNIALKRASVKGAMVLLEPVMKVEVVVPEEFVGEVIGDLNARRGMVRGMSPRGSSQLVEAEVPLEEMFGYATDLRSRTQGRASFTMKFAHYGLMPRRLMEARTHTGKA